MRSKASWTPAGEAPTTGSCLWYAFALETAMRRGELLTLEWQDVHVAQGWVHLPDTKNGSPRDVPLSPKDQAILADLPHDLSGRVFPVHFEALKSAWRRLLGRSGVVGLRFHDLRHEATSRFFEKGLNVMEVATSRCSCCHSLLNRRRMCSKRLKTSRGTSARYASSSR